jgi:hypothetical protein
MTLLVEGTPDFIRKLIGGRKKLFVSDSPLRIDPNDKVIYSIVSCNDDHNDVIDDDDVCTSCLNEIRRFFSGRRVLNPDDLDSNRFTGAPVGLRGRQIGG